MSVIVLRVNGITFFKKKGEERKEITAQDCFLIILSFSLGSEKDDRKGQKIYFQL